MSTYHLPEDRWTSYCSAVNREYAGRPVVLELPEGERGVWGTVDGQSLGYHGVLEELSLQIATSQLPTLLVTITDGARRMHHTMNGVARMSVEQPEPVGTAPGELVVEGEDGRTLTLRLPGSISPDLLAGLQ